MTRSDAALDDASQEAGEICPTWAARVPGVALSELQALRTNHNLLVCEVPGEFWIRPTASSESATLLAANELLAGIVAELFRVTSDGAITPSGSLVPTGRIPTGPWVPIAEQFPVTLPTAGFPPLRMPASRLKFVRSETVVESTVLELPFARLREHVRKTSVLRLNRWEFAVSQNGSALVRGTPLPTLPGQRYWETEGLIVPAGWTWSPSLAPEIVRHVLKLTPSESALFRLNTNDSLDAFAWERIAADAFVQGSRPNFEATFQELSPSVTGED